MLDTSDNLGPRRKSAIVASELSRYSIAVAALQETRLEGTGEMRERTHTFFWSGVPAGERRVAGVSIVVKNTLVGNIVGTPICISSRLMKLKVELQPNCFVTIISAYAPTLDAEVQTKEEFYGLSLIHI